MRLLLLLLLLPFSVHALDMENAKRINKTCALCHGQYSQGTPGMMSPRLAGLPKEYIAKELRYYRDGKRGYAPMVVTSQIKNMTDKDIDDIAEYLGELDIRQMGLPEIPAHEDGNPEAGRKVFMRECKGCHAANGHGKPHKGIPPLAGQYASYLLNQIDRFQRKARFHDDDPEDALFNQFSSADLNNIIAFVTRLPPHPYTADTERMLAMAGMAIDGQAAASLPAIEVQPDDAGIAGRFQVTPAGEILLKPKFNDIRAIAGLKGDFQITADGEIRFRPDAEPDATPSR
ncbi:MAG: c-type cytochrome [Sedimenticolaceae bacterium]